MMKLTVRMLTETQIDVIDMLSAATWLGLLAGLIGLLTGTLILIIRTHRVFNCLLGMLRAVLPSAGIAIVVSLLIALIQITMCKPGFKAGWDVPDWSLSIQAVAIFIAGVFGSLITPRLLPKMARFRNVLCLTLVGGVLGALANLDTAFDGYFVLQSNHRPIHQAVTGLVVGGIVVLLWRFVIEILLWEQRENMPAA
jgi:hypothetical protein